MKTPRSFNPSKRRSSKKDERNLGDKNYEMPDFRISAALPSRETLPMILIQSRLKNRADRNSTFESIEKAQGRLNWDLLRLYPVCRPSADLSKAVFCPYHPSTTTWWWRGSCLLCRDINDLQQKAIETDRNLQVFSQLFPTDVYYVFDSEI